MRRLSILLFGNTNNYPLQLAEGLAALGHGVRLIVNRKDPLHRPESLNPEWHAKYPDWICDLSHVTEEDIAYSTKCFHSLLSELEAPHDLAILNDIGPALARHLKCPHVAFLTGSDLLYFADYHVLVWRSSNWGRDYKYSPDGREYLRQFADLVTCQRQGIETASLVSFGHRGLIPQGDALLDSIGVPDERRTMLYFADLNRCGYREPQLDGPLRVVSGCRVLFARGRHLAMSEPDFKGTDILLEGFKRYCNGGGSGDLRLPAKGQDVDLVRKLVEDLELDDRVHWLPEMPLGSFEDELARAHVVCDQFGTSFPGMVTLAAYAVGRPVVADLRNEVFGRYNPGPLPGFGARTPEAIALALKSLDEDRELIRQTGLDGRRYAEQYLSAEAAARELLRRAGFDDGD